MTIYYWNQATKDSNLFENPLISNAVEHLLSGDYNHHDLEKLNGPQQLVIYSFRLNAVERLLFTSYQDHLHVLEHLSTHDYQKSRFLKKGVLKRYLETHTGDLFESIGSDKPIFHATKLSDPKVSLDYFEQQFIHLTADQQHILSAQLPLIITGIAGSGKTYTALSLLKDYLNTHSVDQRPLLYLTKNKTLVSAVQSIWIDFVDECNRDKVEFKTYAAFAFDQNNTINESYFFDWYQALSPKDIVKTFSCDKAYQEFRTCSGFSLEHYLNLGDRQSQIHDQHDRELWYDRYQRFLNDLLINQIVDPCFSAPTLDQNNQYAMIIVDEAQLLSIHALKKVYQCAGHNNIVYCMDPHQNTEDTLSTGVLLTLALRQEGSLIYQVELSKTHRCPVSVIELLNRLIQMEYHITGGKVDKQESGKMIAENSDNIGFTQFIPFNELLNHFWLLELAKTPSLAIVTHADYIEEAYEHFNTPLIFTPEQIQGLEYHTIVMYKLLADGKAKSILKDINPKWRFFQPQETSVVHRAKKGKADMQYATWFRRFYVGLSRAMDTVIWIDENNNISASFLSLIREVMSKDSLNQDKPYGLEELETKELEIKWKNEQEKLNELGCTEQVNRCYEHTRKIRSDKPKTYKLIEAPKPTKGVLLSKPSSSSSFNPSHKPKNWIQIKRDFQQKMNSVANELILRGLFETLKKNPWISVDTTSANGETMLMMAVFYQVKDIIRDLIPSSNINHTRNDRLSILMFALKREDNETVALLLADDRLVLDYAHADLFHLACETKNKEIIKLLLNSPRCDAFINNVGTNKYYHEESILMGVVVHKLYEIVGLLLQHKEIKLELQAVNKVIKMLCFEFKDKTMFELLMSHEGILYSLDKKRAGDAFVFAAGIDNDEIMERLLLLSHISVDPLHVQESIAASSLPLEELYNGNTITVGVECLSAISNALHNQSFKALKLLLNQQQVVDKIVSDFSKKALIFASNLSVFVVQILLKNEQIFVAVISCLIDQPDFFCSIFRNSPAVFSGFLGCKGKFFEYLKSADKMKVSNVTHQLILKKIIVIDSSIPTPLQMILFRKKANGSFFDDAGVANMIHTLQAIIDETSEHDNDYGNEQVITPK